MRQIVIFGSGLDARAFRLAELGEVDIFEVDSPSVFEFKEPLVKNEPVACRRRVAVQLPHSRTTSWLSALAEHGFASATPTLFIFEGVLMYLPRHTQETILRWVPRRVGHRVSGDAFDTGDIVLRAPIRRPKIRVYGTTRQNVKQWLSPDTHMIDARDDALGPPLMPHLDNSLFPYQRFFFSTSF